MVSYFVSRLSCLMRPSFINRTLSKQAFPLSNFLTTSAMHCLLNKVAAEILFIAYVASDTL
jgi:hypothetical protein